MESCHSFLVEVNMLQNMLSIFNDSLVCEELAEAMSLFQIICLHERIN